MEEPTTQVSPEPKLSPPLHGTRELFDINILPERYRRRRLSLMVLLPWLLLIILLGTIYPTYQLAVNSQAGFREKRQELAEAQAALEIYQSNNQERDDLQTQIDTSSAQRDAIIQSLGGLQLSSSKWSPTLFQIESQIPGGIRLSGLSQQGETIRLNGTADQYELVINLLDSLLALDNLKHVGIDSIERVELENMPTPVPEVEGDSDLSPPEEPTYFRFTILATTQVEVAP
jgi:Tfp pilus assembly protein PilN